jgi:hypothetical protein
VRYFAGNGFLIEAFDVAANELVERAAYVNFDELLVADPLARVGSRFGVR